MSGPGHPEPNGQAEPTVGPSTPSGVSPSPLAVFDVWAEMVATFAGLRAQMVRDGWTDEQARDLIVSMWTIQAKGPQA